MENNTKNQIAIDWFITQMKIKGGVERFVFTVLPLLTQCSWKVRLITLTSDEDYSLQLQRQGIEVITLGARGKWDISALFKLIRLWKASPPVLLHTHLYHAAILGRLAGSYCGIPIIICHQAGPELDRSRWRSVLDTLTSKLVARYLVSSQAVARILHHREGIPYEKISLVPNGIPIPSYSKIYSVERANPTVRLISIGRLSHEKNHKILIQACAELSTKGIPFHLDILGEGAEKTALIQLAKSLKVDLYITFHGFQENPAKWLENADIFILPSKWEGVSLALLEAMAMGLAVIATNTGGTGEVIQNEQNGILVEANNPAEIANTVERLYNHPEYCQFLGYNARRFIIENHSIEFSVQKIEELYQYMLNQQKSY